MLDDEIVDYYDEMMDTYYSSREYSCSQQVVDLLYTDLINDLPEAQRKKLVKLVNALSDDYARTAMAAFATGIRNGGQLLEGEKPI